LRVNLTVNLTDQSYGKSVVFALPLIQNDSRPEMAGPRHDTGNLAIIRYLALSQLSLPIDHHNITGLDLLPMGKVELFGTVGAGKEEVSVDYHIPEELSRVREAHSYRAETAKGDHSGRCISAGITHDPSANGTRPEDASFGTVVSDGSFL
jgi:hypothetical protein